MKTILLLEDEPAVRRLFCLVLRQYTILQAGTAAEALQHFHDHDHYVNLLIADLTLPVSSGTQVALQLRSTAPALPVILSSGCPRKNWTHADADAVERLGADSVTILEKPFFPAALLKRVHEMIGAPNEAAAATGARGAA